MVLLPLSEKVKEEVQSTGMVRLRLAPSAKRQHFDATDGTIFLA
jgi:hypothetical protein